LGSLDYVGERFRGLIAVAGIAALRVLEHVRGSDELIRRQFLLAVELPFSPAERLSEPVHT
jgi:hypothetical protein